MLEMLQGFGVPIVIVGLAIALISIFVTVARNYVKCPPNKVLVVYGRSSKGADGTIRGYRLIRGGSAFVLPLFESSMLMGLDTFSVECAVSDTPNIAGVPVNVEATANLKVSSDPERLASAVERILGKDDQEIHAMLKTTLDGLLRQIIGTLTIEELVKNRERLAQEVLTGAQAELNKLGFQIDVFVVTKVDDKEGYIKALGTKATAEVKRDAEISQAEATRDALVRSSAARKEGETARLAADERVAEANRDLSLKKAGFLKETATAEAEAAMAKSLKEAEIDLELRRRRVAAEEAETAARISLARQEALRMEQELIATKIKPAEAQRESATIIADGAAKAAIRQSEAIKTSAAAEKERLTLEGEGTAAARATLTLQLGKAEAESLEAKGRAQAAVTESLGTAEAARTRATLLAEADGLRAKNDALDAMSDSAKLIVILDRLPVLITHAGDAGQKVVSAAFQHIGEGMSKIGNVSIVDLGGASGGKDPLSRFAGTVPSTVFSVLAQASALGLDFKAIAEKLGIPAGALDGLLPVSGKPANGHVDSPSS